jgi:hypothetical protein
MLDGKNLRMLAETATLREAAPAACSLLIGGCRPCHKSSGRKGRREKDAPGRPKGCSSDKGAFCGFLRLRSVKKRLIRLCQALTVGTFVLLLGLVASAATNVSTTPTTATVQPVVWGQTNGVLQLSLAAQPSEIKKGGKFTLVFKARIHASTNLVFDAVIPTVNGSGIVVVFPDGSKTVHNSCRDKAYQLTIPPGESNLGSFAAGGYGTLGVHRSRGHSAVHSPTR